jgi:hypothetical protein
MRVSGCALCEAASALVRVQAQLPAINEGIRLALTGMSASRG